MFQWYAETLVRYLLVGAAIVGVMFLTYRGLRAAGVRREPATGFALIMPWFLGFFIWNLFPVVASLYLSLTDYNVLQAPNWVGLANYQEILGKDERFWASLRLTMAYSAITVPLGLALALLAATLLNQGVRGVGLWRTLYYLPAILPPFVTALLWRLMLLPTRSGRWSSTLSLSRRWRWAASLPARLSWPTDLPVSSSASATRCSCSC
jgi:multiple sugar transport system permease protein